MDLANFTEMTTFSEVGISSFENLTDSNEFNTSLLGPQRDSLYVVIPMTVIYAVIFFTGVVGNVSTCIVIARNKSMHTATNYYLFSLAVSDLLLLVTGLPQEMYSIWSRYPYVFGETFCILRGLASETSANATVLTITAFTVERYVAICHPFLSHTMSKLSRAIKLIVAIWLVAFSFAVPQALQFGLVYSGPVMCMFKQIIIEHSFELSTFLFFVAPMTLITVLYALIGLRLRSSNMMKKSSGRSEGRRSNGSDPGDRSLSRKTCRNHQAQSSRRVLKMLVAVVVAFFICWAPFHAQRLVAIYGRSLEAETPYKLKIYEIVTYISGVLYYVSTTVNPVLYHIMSNKFREAFKATFSRWCWPVCGGNGRSGRGSRLSDRRSCYSVLSRSGAPGRISVGAGAGAGENRNSATGRHSTVHDSTDSGTSLTHRHSDESMSQHPGAGISPPIAAPGPVQPLGQHEILRCHNPEEVSLNDIPSEKQHLNSFDLHPKIALQKLNSHLYDIQSYERRRSKTARFLEICRCIAKKTLDDKKLHPYDSPLSEHYELNKTKTIIDPKNGPRNGPVNSPKNNPTNRQLNDSLNDRCRSYDVSNSSLRDIENGALEDELTIYMKEIQRRERDKS